MNLRLHAQTNAQRDELTFEQAPSVLRLCVKDEAKTAKTALAEPGWEPAAQECSLVDVLRASGLMNAALSNLLENNQSPCTSAETLLILGPADFHRLNESLKALHFIRRYHLSLDTVADALRRSGAQSFVSILVQQETLPTNANCMFLADLLHDAKLISSVQVVAAADSALKNSEFIGRQLIEFGSITALEVNAGLQIQELIHKGLLSRQQGVTILHEACKQGVTIRHALKQSSVFEAMPDPEQTGVALLKAGGLVNEAQVSAAIEPANTEPAKAASTGRHAVASKIRKQQTAHLRLQGIGQMIAVSAAAAVSRFRKPISH